MRCFRRFNNFIIRPFRFTLWNTISLTNLFEISLHWLKYQIILSAIIIFKIIFTLSIFNQMVVVWLLRLVLLLIQFYLLILLLFFLSKSALFMNPSPSLFILLAKISLLKLLLAAVLIYLDAMFDILCNNLLLFFLWLIYLHQVFIFNCN